MKDKISRYIENEFANSFVIGMQIRYVYLDKSDLRSFVDCALEIENRYQNVIGNRTVRWFISSDENDVLREFERDYQDKIASAYGKLEHIQNDPDAYHRTLLDIEMLTRCDQLILTGGSTFGFVASLYNQKKPYFVEGKRGLQGKCGVLRLSLPARRPEGNGMF